MQTGRKLAALFQGSLLHFITNGSFRHFVVRQCKPQHACSTEPWLSNAYLFWWLVPSCSWQVKCLLNHCLYQILSPGKIPLVKELCIHSLGSFLCLHLIPLGQGEDKMTNSWEHLAMGDSVMGAFSCAEEGKKAFCSQKHFAYKSNLPHLRKRCYLSVLHGGWESSQLTLRKHRTMF